MLVPLPGLCGVLAGTLLGAALLSAPPTPPKDHTMQHAHGTFTVNIGPPTPGAAPGLTRFPMSKVFQGDLEGTGVGEMTAAGDYTKGSAGYVAMELIEGSLQGRRGSFALQHSSFMNAGSQNMNILVSPGSGTGELQGLTGTFTITLKDGQHLYDMEYAMP